MGRKVKIDDATLLNLLDQFFVEECNKDISKLKIPAFAEFVRQNGYEDVQDYLVRRNTAVREHIRQLKSNADTVYQNRAVVFRNLDVESFLSKNTSPAALKKALSERDNYYQQLAEAAAYCIGKYDEQKEEIKKLATEKETLQFGNTSYITENKQLKTRLRENQAEIQKLRTFIDTYVNPEIANELLKQEGLLKTTAGIVSADAVVENIVRSDSNVAPKNTIVRNLFDKI